MEVLLLDEAGREVAPGEVGELGGDSVLVARVASRLEERLATRVPLRRILEFPTIAGLVAGLGITKIEAHEVEREQGEI
jgi:hypothetical protein